MKVFYSSKVFTGRKMIENGAVLFDGDKIIAVGRKGEITVPEDAEAVDFGNRLLMPGMIDCHTHLTLCAQVSNYAKAMKDEDFVKLARATQNIRTDLLSGVTTMRAMGDINFIDIALKDAVEKGIIPSPRLLVSGRGIKSSYGHGIMGTAYDGCDEIRKAARINICEGGADQIKLFVTGSKGEFRNFKFATEHTAERCEMHCLMTLEEIRAAVEVAHCVGKKVAAHCYGGVGLHYCVEAGVDTIEHGIYMDDEDIELMVKSNTWLDMTFSGYFSDKRLENRGTPELTGGFARYRESIRYAYQKALDSGVRHGLGSDGWHGMFCYEVESLAGMKNVTNIQALTTATADAAELCGVEDKVGMLEAGKLADFVVFEGDPSVNIKDIEKIHQVYIGGKLVSNISAW